MILRKLGVLGAGEVATAEDASIAYEAIDARLKELDTRGMLWWNVSGAVYPVTLTAGTATATIAADDFLYPVAASITVGTSEKPIEVIDHRTYHAIENKTQAGEPERVFIDGDTAYFWPVPSSGATFNLTYQAISADASSGQTLDVPAAAIRAFVDLVTGDLVDDYGLPSDRAGRLLAKQKPALLAIRMVSQQRTDSAVVTAEYF
jgi:hypothetical protein